MCRSCSMQITYDKGVLDICSNAQMSIEKNSCRLKLFSSLRNKSLKSNRNEHAIYSEVSEYWIQEYVKNNYFKLGFSELHGPFDVGPDFRGTYKKKNVLVEVERHWQSYITHKHTQSDAFNEVSILIVLNPAKPPEAMKTNLPQRIIYLDIDDFVNWWRINVQSYAKMKRIEFIIYMIANEFKMRFVRSCVYKDNSMTTCMACDLCPYFGNGIAYESSAIFQQMAFKFVAFCKLPITSEDFHLSIIKPLEIDHFYNGYRFDTWPNSSRYGSVFDSTNR